MKNILDSIISDIQSEIPEEELTLPGHQQKMENIIKSYPVLLMISRLPYMIPHYICKKGLQYIGIQPNTNANLETELITTLMHRENLSVIAAAFQHFNNNPKGDFTHPYRVKAGQKEWRWVYGYSRALNFAADGRAEHVVSIFCDIESNLHHTNGTSILPINREPARQEDVTRFNNLTMRERAVLRLLSDGMNDERVAWELGISPHTAHSHRKNLYQKLGVNNIAQAMKYAFLFDHLNN